MLKKRDLQNYKIARFALNTPYEKIGEENIDILKRHLLDALGSFLFATDQPPILKLVQQIGIMGDGGKCVAPHFAQLPYDRAAQLYTALIRYPDFMDNYMGKEATCHPSDNIGPLLAAAQYKRTSGKQFLASMAIAYQLCCRLVNEIPVMIEGIDHTLLLGYSMTAAVARLLNLTEDQTAHALGMAGSSISPMVTSRAAYTFEWKGFQSSLDAMNCVNVAFLAQQGMTGPLAIFEGPKGFEEVFDMKLDYDWDKENFELIKKCSLKLYNAEVHSQSSLYALAELRKKHLFNADDIESVEVTTFFTAYHIIGSGAYGDRQIVYTKEQADHSLFYVSAVLLLDGDVYPEQFAPERIRRADVQELLKKIKVRTSFPIHKPVKLMGAFDRYTEAYPDKVMTKVQIRLKNGEVLTGEEESYPGFFATPFGWDEVIAKFNRLTKQKLDDFTRAKIIDIVRGLDKEQDMISLVKLISSK